SSMDICDDAGASPLRVYWAFQADRSSVHPSAFSHTGNPLTLVSPRIRIRDWIMGDWMYCPAASRISSNVDFFNAAESALRTSFLVVRFAGIQTCQIFSNWISREFLLTLPPDGGRGGVSFSFSFSFS